MPIKELIVDFETLTKSPVVATLDDIRKVNPQRFEMEALSAIVYSDVDTKTCAGYKDVTDQEFWVRGHMPGMPLMPGVVMCETAAQLCSYFTLKYDLIGAEILGLGGMENVRFRDTVSPGQRFYVVAQMVKVRRGAMIVSRFQGIVNGGLVCEGEIKGVPIPGRAGG